MKSVFQLSRKAALLALFSGIVASSVACSGKGSSPTAPSGGVGTLVVTILDGGAPAAPGTKIQIAQNNKVLGEVGVDALGVAKAELEYGKYSVKVMGFGLEEETRTVEHGSAETPVQFTPKAKDDVELTQLIVDGKQVAPGGSMPRSGKMVLRGRHRQVTIPWPGKIHASIRFLNSQTDSGTLVVKGGFYDTTNPTPNTWEVRMEEFYLACETCTSAGLIKTTLTKPYPPNGGELVQLAERTQEWPVTFR